MSMRLLKIVRRPTFAVWTYWHPSRGTLHALVGDHEPNVTHVGAHAFCVSGCRSRNSRQRKPANPPYEGLPGHDAFCPLDEIAGEWGKPGGIETRQERNRATVMIHRQKQRTGPRNGARKKRDLLRETTT
jgi:hypothetical protein